MNILEIPYMKIEIFRIFNNHRKFVMFFYPEINENFRNFVLFLHVIIFLNNLNLLNILNVSLKSSNY